MLSWAKLRGVGDKLGQVGAKLGEVGTKLRQLGLRWAKKSQHRDQKNETNMELRRPKMSQKGIKIIGARALSRHGGERGMPLGTIEGRLVPRMSSKVYLRDLDLT